MKKVVALSLAAVLLFCLAIPVFADESEQITADIVGYSDARVEKKDLTNVPGFAEFANATDDQKAEFAKNSKFPRPKNCVLLVQRQQLLLH